MPLGALAPVLWSRDLDTAEWRGEPGMGRRAVRVTVEGADELIAKLKALPEAVASEALVEAVMAGAEVVRAAAALKAPRESGGLAESIVAAIDPARTESTRATARVGPDAEHFYGQFEEFGHAIVPPGPKGTKRKAPERKAAVTGHTPPHPFLRPALDESKREVEAAIMAVLKAKLGL